MSTTKNFAIGDIVSLNKQKADNYFSVYFNEVLTVLNIRPAANPKQGNYSQDVLVYSEGLLQSIWVNAYWLEEKT